MSRYEIQTYTLFGGWTNIWTVDEKPEVFDSFGEAVDSLDDHLSDLDSDKIDYNREDYRIHLIKENESE